MSQTRLVIAGADSDTVFQLRSLLELQTQIQLLGELHSLDAIKRVRPDVILVGGPEDVAIPFCERVVVQSPKTKVVLLTESGEEQHVNWALGVGVYGVVLKSNLATDTFKAISAVSKGYCFLSPEIAGAVIAFYRAVPA